MWCIVSLSVAVGADTAIFSSVSLSSDYVVVVFFFPNGLPDCSHQRSWVGRMHLHVARGARGWTVTQICVAALQA